MKKVIFISFVLFFLFSVPGRTDTFKKVNPDELKFVKMDSRSEIFKGTQDRSSEVYEVWFATEADCDDIRITLSGNESDSLYCGRLVGFLNVPPATYSIVVKGCGGEFSGDLTVEGDLDFAICPSLIDMTDCCSEGVYPDGSYFCDDECPGESTGTTTITSNPTTTTSIGDCPTERIYGEHSAETEILRNFRDTALRKTLEGQEIINLYYQWGPLIVKAMEEDEAFKGDVKELIDGILSMINETGIRCKGAGDSSR